jgi:hypothetical protein
MKKFPVKCLTCGNVFWAYKSDYELSKPRQCFKCWSYAVIPVAEIQAIADETWKLMNEKWLGFIPLIDALITTVQYRGLRFRPIETLRLAREVVEELRRRGLIP